MPHPFKRNLWILIALFALICGFNGVKKKTLRIVFIGDSITEGAAVADKERFTPPAAAVSALREMALIKNAEGFNMGKSGATTLDFLPGTAYFNGVIRAADDFKNQARLSGSGAPKCNVLIFSIMLGTNDSAIEGTNGAPVSARQYRGHLQAIIDTLMKRYPEARFVIHEAPWYSDNTYNSAKYLKEGRDRLMSYDAAITRLLEQYQRQAPARVFMGDRTAYDYFSKKYKQTMAAENGQQGVFYLHPNDQGSKVLGRKWAKAIYKAAFKNAL